LALNVEGIQELFLRLINCLFFNLKINKQHGRFIMKKKRIYLSITFIFVLLSGFYALTPAQAVDDFSGDWQGLMESDSGLIVANLSLRLIQNGTSVSGLITFRNTDCGTFYDEPLTDGSISNNLIAFNVYLYCPDDYSDNELRFRRGDLLNNTVSGFWTVISDGEFYDSGTYSLKRSINYIQASAAAGGTISPSGKVLVTAGADQTFKITPDNGYKVSDVKVDGVSIGAKTIYTFQDVSANHTITATFGIIPKATSIFVPNILVPLLLDDN
jgi:hypothetical protein